MSTPLGRSSSARFMLLEVLAIGGAVTFFMRLQDENPKLKTDYIVRVFLLLKRFKVPHFFHDDGNGRFNRPVGHVVDEFGSPFVLGWKVRKFAAMLAMIDVPASNLLQETFSDSRSVFVSLTIAKRCQLGLILRFEFRLLQRSHCIQFFRSRNLRILFVVLGDLQKHILPHPTCYNFAINHE